MQKAKLKSHKLKSTKTLSLLFEKGQTLKSGSLILYFVTEENKTFDFNIGFGGSKRRMRKASDRNHSKRILREAFFHTFNTYLPEFEKKKVKMALMLIHNGEKLLSLRDCQEKIKLILKRLIKEID